LLKALSEADEDADADDDGDFFRFPREETPLLSDAASVVDRTGAEEVDARVPVDGAAGLVADLISNSAFLGSLCFFG